MSKKYWNLFIKMDGESQWSYHFGDYDKSVVKDEQADCLDAEGCKTWILQSEDSQESINQCIAYARNK